MAANLEILQNGVANFVANTNVNGRKEIPWHGLGKFFDKPLTITEALSNLNDFQVNKGKLLHVSDEIIEMIMSGQPVNHLFKVEDIVNTHNCTYRVDNNHILGIVGSGYEVVQNVDGFAFIDEVCHESKAKIETAGFLGNGERMFITAKMPDRFNIGIGDEIEQYILFTNAHDGTNAVTACFTPIRVVCNNTLNAALRGTNATNRVYFKHTKNVSGRLNMAAQVLKNHEGYIENLKELLSNMRAKKFNEKDVRNILAATFLQPNEAKQVIENNGIFESLELPTRSKNTLSNCLNTIENGVGQNVYRGTGLWLYNGLTCYFQNVNNYRNDEQKLENIVGANGTASKKINKAIELVLAA